jgi:hypothetical protein
MACDLLYAFVLVIFLVQESSALSGARARESPHERFINQRRLYFRGMRFFKRSSKAKRCGIPFCESPAVHTVKAGKDLYPFCAKHYRQAKLASEALRHIDDKWLTEERKRRMFDPTPEEKSVMDNLVRKGMLELYVRGGKPTFRPTERFADQVAEAEVDLMVNHLYRASMCTMMEEAVKIAVRRRDPNVGSEEDRYTEIVAPFVLFDRMDRDLNPLSDRYKHGRIWTDKAVEESVDAWFPTYVWGPLQKRQGTLYKWIYSFKGWSKDASKPSGLIFSIAPNLLTVLASAPIKKEIDEKLKNGCLTEKKKEEMLTLIRQQLKKDSCSLAEPSFFLSPFDVSKSLRYDQLSKESLSKAVKDVMINAQTCGVMVKMFVWQVEDPSFLEKPKRRKTERDLPQPSGLT